MPSNSSGSATDVNASETAEFYVTAGGPTFVPPINTATSRPTNLLPPSLRVAGNDIPIRRREAAAMVLRITIGEPEVLSVPFFFHTHAA